MAVYKSDHSDILFNLIDVLKVQNIEEYGFDESSVKEILNEYDKFVENEIYPTRQKSDEEGVKLTPNGVIAPACFQSVTKSYYEMGWFALGLPEEIGGSPVPHALSTMCLSLSAGANTAWSMYPGLSKGALNVLRLVGDDYIKSTYLEPMITGRFGGTMCLTEAGAGSDVGNLKTTAKPIDGENGWYSIKGTKIFISSGESDLYENNIHLVLARTPQGKPGPKGISLFLVPRYRLNDDGSNGESNDVRCSGVEHKMGIHGSATCVMNFGDNDDCRGYLIGNEFEGMQNMFIMMNEARLDVGIQGESQASLAYELTKQYAAERVQFGTSIIDLPDVRRTLLKMRAMSRGLRSLMLYTSNLFDLAKTDKKYESYIGLLVPICKAFGSDAGFNTCVDAVQVHGGYGYCTEYGIEQFVRDTKIASLYEGTNGIQAIDFVMRKILKDKGAALRAISEDVFKTSNQLSDEFSFERGIFSKSLAAAQDAMGFIGKMAKENKMNMVLQNCTDFLELSSHIVVAWRLMESAWIANEKIEAGASDDEKEFLESKIVDFKIYCSHYLVDAIARSKTITSSTADILEYKI
ncbi:MAG: acyl-CoA dehydrogenase [Bacteriovoracaceae bacterium]|jgi:alkylation response protein AidB-like acyl-CoA dehydrogenase|nr:acyl-CoA dehydrogenase [Bacteriovoracaceae bacterium]